MPEPDLRQLLAAAHSRVGAARTLLARPRACNAGECITLLREAEGYLEWVRDSLPRAGPDSRNLRAQATALAVEIRQAGVLLDQAARRGRRWLGGLRSTSPEYTASGSAVPLRFPGRISFTG